MPDAFDCRQWFHFFGMTSVGHGSLWESEASGPSWQCKNPPFAGFHDLT